MFLYLVKVTYVINCDTLPRVCVLCVYMYIYIQGADKSLARPGRKQTNVSVRMA